MVQLVYRFIFLFMAFEFVVPCIGQGTATKAIPDSLSTIAVCPQQDIFDILTKEKLHAPKSHPGK